MTCPQCKEEMPLLSRICPVCGYVADNNENRPSASEFVDLLEELLHKIKALPAPSFTRSMGQLSVVMLPLLALFLLAAALISEAGIFWIAFGLLTLGSLTAIVLKICGQLGNSRSDRRFSELKNNFEHTFRTARRDFGKNREVASLLNEITEQINTIEHSRRAASRRNLLIWLGILLLVIMLAGQGVRSVDKAVTVQEENGWQEAVEAFRTSGANDEYNTRGRSDLLEQILAAGEPAAAEKFFRNHCMGRIGDYDCAAMIIGHYLSTDNKAAAERFAETCKLRYKSDRNKLKKLLTN